MFSSIPLSLVLLSTFLLLASAQSNTTRSEAISDAFLQCSKKPSSTCPDVYKIDSCITSLIPDFWDIFDAHHNSSDISTTPLGEALSNTKLKSCVCAEAKLQGLEECVSCVREGSKLHTGELDLFGVGFVAERVCGVVLPGFGLSQEGRDNSTTMVFDLPPSTTKTNSTITLPPGSRKNETEPELNPGRKNGTDTDSEHGGKNGTSTPGKNETVQTPTPSPTEPEEEASASESEAAAMKLAGDVVRHVGGPAGIAAVVAFGMSFL